MFKDGKDWHGLRTTKLKKASKLFKTFNLDCAPLRVAFNHRLLSEQCIITTCTSTLAKLGGGIWVIFALFKVTFNFEEN